MFGLWDPSIMVGGRVWEIKWTLYLLGLETDSCPGGVNFSSVYQLNNDDLFCWFVWHRLACKRHRVYEACLDTPTASHILKALARSPVKSTRQTRDRQQRRSLKSADSVRTLSRPRPTNGETEKPILPRTDYKVRATKCDSDSSGDHSLRNVCSSVRPD